MIEQFDDSIPTLTEIVSPGDDSMKNHFDASCLDEVTDNDIPATPILQENTLDEEMNDETFNIEFSADEDETHPPIIAEPVILEAAQSDSAADIGELHSTIELLIDDALKETLPSIERQLKRQLSETIIKKLSQQLDGQGCSDQV